MSVLDVLGKKKRRLRKPPPMHTAVSGVALTAVGLIAAIPAVDVVGVAAVAAGAITPISELAERRERSREFSVTSAVSLTVVHAFEFEQAAAEAGLIRPRAGKLHRHRDWFANGAITWDGISRLGAEDRSGRTTSWPIRPGGILADHRPGPYLPLAQRRADGSPSKEVVEIAAVMDRVAIRWLLLLDDHGRQVASLPTLGFDETGIVTAARCAGIHYRRYLLEVTAYDGPRVDIEHYFPRSAHFVLVDGPRPPVDIVTWTAGKASAMPSSWSLLLGRRRS